MRFLTHEEIRRLHKAIVSSGLIQKRDALLAGISRDFVGSLQAAHAPGDQLLLDLHALHDARCLADGTVPLSMWADNALLLAGSRPEAAFFEHAIARCRIIVAAQFFLSYHRQGDDAALANRLSEILRELGHSVFLDVATNVETKGAAEIRRKIETCDVFVVLISEEAIDSEMVHADVADAYRRKRSSGPSGRPILVPVRVRYDGLLDYELDCYLGQLHPVRWDGLADTGRVIDHILQRTLPGDEAPAEPAVASRRSHSPSLFGVNARPAPAADLRFFTAQGGTLPAEDRLYVCRRGDDEMIAGVRAVGHTLVIKGPRQSGKSSLLVRYLAACLASGKRVASIDFSMFSGADFETYPTFLSALAGAIIDELKIDTPTPVIRRQSEMARFLQKQVLEAVAGPLVLAFEDVDRVAGRTCQDEFFAMLRSWHNSRAHPQTPAWRALDLVLVISTEPHLLIEAMDRSPFNIGQTIALDSLTLNQCRDLDGRYRQRLLPAQIEELYQLLHGHPYLTRLTYYRMIAESMPFDDLVRTSADAQGPFGDHLRALLRELSRDEHLLPALKQIIKHGTANDPKLVDRLHGLGLVREKNGRYNPSNLLYAKFFKNAR